jgi:arylsulfatase A-like enzyme
MHSLHTRRQFAGGLLGSALAAAQHRGKPNIVLVLSDDHSYPHLGCFGDQAAVTPNLDRFAREGMRFHRAFTTAPTCVPSRVSMLTGRSPIAARVGRFNSPLPPDITTLPDWLRPLGYFTGICRRTFHLDGTPPGPVVQDIMDRNGMRTFDRRVDFLDRDSPRTETKNKLNQFFAAKPKDRPFFLWVNFHDPHYPWDRNAIPKPHDPSLVTVPPYLPDLPSVREALARYYDEITRMDEEFSWVLDALQTRGFADNTIVIFMGDNGYAFPHGKGALHDPGLNVPLLIRWPGVVKPGSETRELISGEDISLTLLDAVGGQPPPYVTGHSFLPLLRGQRFDGRKYIFGERGQHGARATFREDTLANAWDLSRCIRSGRHKLIFNCTPHMRYAPVNSTAEKYWQDIVAAYESGELAPQFERAFFIYPRPVFELYDLANDPGELNNLAGKAGHEVIEKELRLALMERMVLTYDFLPLPEIA